MSRRNWNVRPLRGHSHLRGLGSHPEYILFYKPFGVLSQFTDDGKRPTLKNFGPFPADVYPAGRLDMDSEGLILLTNDSLTKHRLEDPKFGHPRTYLVQIERIPSDEVLDSLRRGLVIEDYRTKPADVELIEGEPNFPPRSIPIRYRKSVPTRWIKMILYEGKNRQVRKMTAAVGHPALRLIRTTIANLTIEGLKPGEHRFLKTDEINSLRGLLLSPAKKGPHSARPLQK
jgi:23S rRNA pseudouridine2457 synthase